MSGMLIDITRLLYRRMQGRLPTGVDRVSLEYVRHFGKRSTALVRLGWYWIELSGKDSGRLFEGLLSPSVNFNFLAVRIVAKSLHRTACKQSSSPRFFLNTGHSGLEKRCYADYLHDSGFIPLFFVHDLIPLTHPEYCRPGEAVRHTIRMNTLLDAGHGVIANSAATLEDLAVYAKTNKLFMPPAMIAHLAPASLPAPAASAPLDKPYFVILGTIEPRKNHLLLLQVWRQLIERFGEAAPRLVIIGQRGWECENVVDMLERCGVLKSFVFEYPICSDAELASWLQHARALLFPSFTEGYGMPLVEALAMGTPVIASNLPVFQEIAGDVPEYVDPLDGKRWADLIIEYASPESLVRQDQCRRMTGFTVPTWDAHFEQVEELMARLKGTAA